MSPPATLVQKIIARAAGRASVRPGEVVTARVDFAYAHDSSGPRRWKPMLEALGARVWDPSKLAIVNDHYVPATDAESAGFLKIARDFARDQGVSALFDMVGISHLVLADAGLIRPGAFIAGGDSHTPMGGAFGAYAAGYGATDMVGIVATGETWLSVPATLRIDWRGRLRAGVTAKDVMLQLAREVGEDNAFKAVEFGGSTVAAMTMRERMVLCNMAAELGAETGVVAPDAVTFAYLEAAGRPVADEAEALALRSDPGAEYEAAFDFEAGTLAPQIAAPHSPGVGGPVEQYAGVRIDQAYVGACMGAKIDDLRMVAAVLNERRVHPRSRLLVAPASATTLREAEREGVLRVLLEAGALLLPPGCGACAGYGGGVLAAGEVCISSTNRNFRGRMGHADSQVYLASPYAVAAAAVAGEIVDPRPMLPHGAFG